MSKMRLKGELADVICKELVSEGFIINDDFTLVIKLGEPLLLIYYKDNKAKMFNIKLSLSLGYSFYKLDGKQIARCKTASKFINKFVKKEA